MSITTLIEGAVSTTILTEVIPGPQGLPGLPGLNGIGAGSGSFVNAKDAPYNATGDGVTDDTNALQAAANSAALAGDPLYIPSGVYRVRFVQLANLGTALTFSGIPVIGAGKGTTVLRGIASGMTQTTNNRLMVVKANSHVSHLTIDGDRAASTLDETLNAAATLVNVQDGQNNVTFDHIEVKNQYSSGVYVDAANPGAEGFGLVAKAVDNLTITNSDFYDCSGSGAGTNATDGVNRTKSVRVEGCKFYNNGFKKDGITARTAFIGGKGFASSFAEDVVIVNCRAWNNVEMGLNFEETLRAVVDNCDVFGSGEFGVNTWGYGEFLQIMNSRLRNNGTSAASAGTNRYGSIAIRYSDSEVPAGLMQAVYIYNTVIETFVNAKAATIVVRSTSTVGVGGGALEPTFYTNHPGAGSWTYASQVNLAAFVDNTLNGTLVTTPYTNNEAYRVTKGTLSITPGVIAAQSRVAIAVTLAGLASGDILILHFPTTAPSNGIIYGGHTVAAGVVTVYLANVTAASITNNTALDWPYEWHDYT